MRSGFVFLLAAVAMGACAELNKPASDPPRYEPPPPVANAPDAAPPAPSASGVTQQPGDVQL